MPTNLSRREREIMDIIYRRGRATAREVLDDLADPPGYSAVRALLRILAEKGHLQHRQDGPRYVFSPSVPRRKAAVRALGKIVRTFFDGSTVEVVSALLGASAGKLSREELDELTALIEAARDHESKP